MHIHARVLKSFDMIRRCGSIREAARQLHIASSAINRQLLQLEDTLGMPLFERLPHGLELTAAGEAFARHVQNVFQDERRLSQELGQLQGLQRGPLHVMAVEGLCSDLLPRVLAKLFGRYPGLSVQLHTGGSAATAQAVRTGDADIGLGFSITADDELQACCLRRDPIGAVLSPDHPLAGRATLGLAECAQVSPLILPVPSLSLHALLAPLLHRLPEGSKVLLETASLDLAKRLAQQGLGIAFQSRWGLEQEIAQRQLVHVPLHAPAPVWCELGVYVRARRSLPPAVTALVHLLMAELAD